jgi:hypothetical protein
MEGSFLALNFIYEVRHIFYFEREKCGSEIERKQGMV